MLPEKQSHETSVDAIVRGYFMNESVTPASFKSMSKTDRKALGFESMLHESLQMLSEKKDIVATAHTHDSADTLHGEKYAPGSSLSVVYFNKILASKGDIRKTPNYANNRTMISYSRTIAQAQVGDDATKAFLSCIGAISDAIDNLERYSSEFLKSMNAEIEKAGSLKDLSKCPISHYYLNLVVMLDVTLDVLYSTSIQGTFDQTQKPPLMASVSFKTNPEIFDESMTLLRSFNTLAFSGKLKQAIASENFEAVMDAQKRVLHEENVLDVAFAMLASNKWTELFLLPLFTIRSVVYVVKFLTVSYSKVAFSLAKSVEMIRKDKITQEEFATYKHDADRKGVAFDHATRKAAIEVQSDVRDNKQGILDLAKQNQSGETVAL